jgi:DNA-binding beta-propeller fold protein YncE
MAPQRIKTINMDHICENLLSNVERQEIRVYLEAMPYWTGLWKWLVKASNGKIYCPPALSSRVLCIDPATEELTLIGGDIEYGSLMARYTHAALANNGCIYCIPSEARRVLKINTLTDTISFIDYPKRLGSVRCILGLDSNIYFADDGQVYQLNPSTDTVAAFGPRYQGCAILDVDVVASNGKIYAKAIFDFEVSLVVIDPAAGTVAKCTLIPDDEKLMESDLNQNGVLRHDGKVIYVSQEGMAVVDPTTDVITLIKNPSNVMPNFLRQEQGPRALHGGTSGRLYELIGAASNRVDEYDLVNNTWRSLGPTYIRGEDDGMPWVASIVGKDGMIYGIPAAASRVLCVDARTRDCVSVSEIEPTFRKTLSWFDGLLADNGKIYCVPSGLNGELLVIDTSRWAHVGDHILIRCLVDKRRAEVNMNDVLIANEVHLLDFIFAASPQGVFAIIVSFL